VRWYNIAMDQLKWKARHWALFTIVMYAMTLFALSWPLLKICFWKEVHNTRDLSNATPYWVWLGAFSLAEGALLLLPISMVRQRPVPRRRWFVLAATAGLMFGLLIASLVFTLTEVLYPKDYLADPVGSVMLTVASTLGLLGWIFWGCFFWRASRKENEGSWLNRLRTYLLAGSIAELLIAVPSHIYVRNKNECCAGLGTFVGLSTGLSVLLFAFGPGVFFLFAERVASLQRARDAAPEPSFQTHGRDTFVWSSLALLFLLTPVFVSTFSSSKAAEEFVPVCRISFMVLSAAAAFNAWRSYKRTERLWGLVVVFAIYLSEVVLLTAAIWTAIE
jgi:hypothetical protein